MKTRTILLGMAATMLTLTTVAFDKNKPATTRTVGINKDFTTIKVGSNIRLILVPQGARSAMATITGDASLVDKINITQGSNRMIITSDGNVEKGQVTIHVPVSELAAVDLEQGSELSSEGDLAFRHLTVSVDVNSKVNLKVKGKVVVATADNCDFVYQKPGQY